MAPTLYDRKPNPGDLIEICRGPYCHWALYIGDGYVIHLVPPSEVAGAGANSLMSLVYDYAVVRCEYMFDVVGMDSWKIKNLLDDKYQVRDINIIIKEACSQVGKKVTYNIWSHNCEHFVTSLRYGKAESRQVRNAEIGAIGGMIALVGVVGLGLLIGSSVGQRSKERNNKQ